jgi:hypothetical protein
MGKGSKWETGGMDDDGTVMYQIRWTSADRQRRVEPEPDSIVGYSTPEPLAGYSSNAFRKIQ